MPSKTSRPEGRQIVQPRLRVLAGPNGSGKSTIKGELKPQWIGAFVNADEIERDLRANGGVLDLEDLGVAATHGHVLRRMRANTSSPKERTARSRWPNSQTRSLR